jgi:hypothetical protein
MVPSLAEIFCFLANRGTFVEKLAFLGSFFPVWHDHMSAIPVSQRSTLEEPRILPWIALLRSFAGHFLVHWIEIEKNLSPWPNLFVLCSPDYFLQEPVKPGAPAALGLFHIHAPLSKIGRKKFGGVLAHVVRVTKQLGRAHISPLPRSRQQQKQDCPR